ncbi:hypothetical protein [Azospirillum sp. TSO22-1]|uniref:hypothetical protein n=1 Tax=Azospirillum sp. TSO22-1 TaxID=716789 RepID=UPI000D60485B|nr:hypothetical protein [Azospirillum sp. TSO22-1]PWC40185.1 hypothetical protein TSO221_25780 [Azospirillum sp. TSO22-1]
MAHALLTRIAAALTGALLLIAGTASAQHALPAIDLFVFLDNSKTVFTGGPDGPNQRLAEMLKTAFTLPIDGPRTFVSRDDRVSLYTFGREVLPLADRIEGGNTAALNDAVARFTEAITPDKVTDFRPLLRFIAGLPALQDRADNRLKIVLIASDFIHDPSNQAENSNGTGICDLLKQYRATQKTAVAADVEALRRTIASRADPDQLPIYVGLLAVRPTEADFAATSKGYRDCALETVRLRPLTQSLEKELGAQVIEYADASKDLNQFARELVDSVLRATRPRLAVTGGACQPRGLEGLNCSLAVSNPARVSNRLRTITLYDRPDGPVLATVNADDVIEGNAAKTVALRLGGNEARALLAATAIYAGLDSDGRGVTARVRIEKGVGGGLTITGAKAERKVAGRPADLTVTLANPQPDPRLARSIVFSATQQGGPGLGRIDLPEPPDVARGATRELSISLTPAIDQALDRGAVYASVLSMDGERAGDPESPRVRIEYRQAAPLRVNETRIRLTDGRAELALDVESPGPPLRPVRNVLFYARGSTTPFRVEPVPGGPAMVPSGRRVTVTVALGDDAVEVLNDDGLSVAVEDAANGRPSAPVPVARPASTATSLRIAGLRWLENGVAGQLRARVTVINDNPRFQETLAALVLHGAAGERLVKRVEPAVTLARSASADVPLTFDGRDLGVQSILRQPLFRMQAVDDQDNAGAESERYPTPPYTALRLVSPGVFEANDRGGLDLRLEVENPALVSNRLLQVRMYAKGGRPEQAEVLPLPAPVNIAGGGRETVRIPFNKNFFRAHSPHLEQNLVLVDETGQSVSGRVPLSSFPVTPLPSKPLKLADAAEWTDALPLVLTVTVLNEAPYSQTLGRLLLAATEGSEPEVFDPPNGIEIRGASREGNRDVPMLLRVAVPMQDEWQDRLLAGQELRVCALTDLEATSKVKTCAGGWVPVGLPRPTPLTVQMNGDRPFDPQRKEIRIDVANPGIVPNLVTGYALQSSDGRQDFVQKTLDKAEPVRAGKTVTLSIPLSDGEARAVAAAQSFRVVLRDKTPANAGSGSAAVVPVTGRIPVFDYEVRQFKATKVPKDDGYIWARADIEIKNTSFMPLGRQNFLVWMADRRGEIVGAKIALTHDFSGFDHRFAVPVAWGIPESFSDGALGSIMMSPTAAPDFVKSYGIVEKPKYDLSVIMMASLGFTTLVTFVNLILWFLRRRGVGYSRLLPVIGANGPSYLDRISSWVSFLNSFVGAPFTVGAGIGLLGYFDYLGLTILLTIVAAVLSVFGVIAVVARIVKKTRVRQIAAKGEEAREMPAILRDFDMTVAKTVMIVFLASAAGMVFYGVWHTPTDPLTVKHHWDIRETQGITTAQN